MSFEPVGPVPGQLTRVGRQRTLASTSTHYVRLGNIRAGFFPLLAGSQCRTSEPVVIDSDTPAGEFFGRPIGWWRPVPLGQAR